MSRAARTTPAATRHIAYNSCRNRHCPKCQAAAAREWMEARTAELLPVPYFHVVFTLPAAIADIAYQNKRVIYDLLFKASAETMLTIAADPKHLGAKIGITSVLHTWGSAMTHHPHVHMIVPGGGLSTDGERWVRLPQGLLPARAGALEAVPAPNGGEAYRRPSSGNTILLLPALAEPGVQALPATVPPTQVVRLRQAPLRRPEGGARLSVALHAPRRDLEPPPRQGRRHQRELPRQGLPRRPDRRWRTMTLDAQSSSAAS